MEGKTNMKEISNNIGMEKSLPLLILEVYIYLNTRKGQNYLYRRSLDT